MSLNDWVSLCRLRGFDLSVRQMQTYHGFYLSDHEKRLVGFALDALDRREDPDHSIAARTIEQLDDHLYGCSASIVTYEQWSEGTLPPLVSGPQRDRISVAEALLARQSG